MSPDPLNSDTGVPRRELEAKLKAVEQACVVNTLAVKEELRSESRAELKVITEKLASLETRTRETQAQVNGVSNDLAEVRGIVKGLEAGQKQIQDSVETLAKQTVTIEEETADGRKITKHFRSWGNVYDDIKSLWPHAVAAFLGYKAAAGWFAAHGITWATIWSAHK